MLMMTGFPKIKERSSMNTLTIDFKEAEKMFRLNTNGKLERHFKRSGWRIIKHKAHSDGYCRVGWNGRNYRYARLVWVICNKKDIPDGFEIDHIDLNRLNDNITNLRIVTHRKNNQNRFIHGINQKGKLVGSCFNKHREKYEASITINDKKIFLGYFATEKDAHEIYVKACKERANNN